MNKLKIVIVLLMSLALFLSCQTSPVSVVEYKNRPIPTIIWPSVPDPSGFVVENPDGTVSMPASYWLALIRYIIDIETGIDLIEAYRAQK